MNDTDGTYYDICQASKLEYYLHGLDTLTQLLQVAGELVAETGMQDWIITHRGCRMRYCWQDAKAVAAGAMGEEEYIRRNSLPPCNRHITGM